jgi:hypothetical protein
MEDLDKIRLSYGLWVIGSGFLLVGGIAVGAMIMMEEAQEITVMVGSVTGLVGTVVGAYLGVQVGSAGTERAEMARRQMEERFGRMAGVMNNVDTETMRYIMTGQDSASSSRG